MSISAVASTGSNSYWEELLQRTKDKKAGRNEDLVSGLFNELDTDGNGIVSLQESGLDQESYEELDADQDGSVTLDELKKAVELQYKATLTRIRLGDPEEASSSSSTATDASKARAALADIFGGASPSAGSDGTAQSSQAAYDALDSNQDGIVSLEELLASLQQTPGSEGAAGRKIADALLSLVSQTYSAISGTAARNQTVSLEV